jgi:putative hydrolase of HD superfamily
MRGRCLEEDSEFLDYLKFDTAEHSENEKFLLAIRRLQSSFRWNRMRRQYPVSVMSHLFFVFFLSYAIGNVEGKNVDEVTDMMKTALYHDIPEAITGDIITPTKKSVPGFEELIAEVEVEMLDEYLLDFMRGHGFLEDLRKRMLEPWSCENGKLIKMADVFSALFEAKIEAPVSYEFAEVYRRVRHDLHKRFESPSVGYLFRNGVDPFEENLEEILRATATARASS